MRVIRKIRAFDAYQFFQNRKPWPECIQSATSPMGMVLPHAHTDRGVSVVADGDWILTDTAGRVYHVGQREFREDYEEVTYGPIEAPHSEGVPERAESPTDPRSGGVPDRATPPSEVQSGGLLRTLRPDCPPAPPSAPVPEAHTGQVEQLPPLSQGSDPGVPGTGVGEQGGVDLPRPKAGPGDLTHLGPSDPSSWKYQALKYEASQDELRKSLGLPPVLGPDGKPVKK